MLLGDNCRSVRSPIASSLSRYSVLVALILDAALKGDKVVSMMIDDDTLSLPEEIGQRSCESGKVMRTERMPFATQECRAMVQ